MLIIKKAVPAVAKQASVRSCLSRIDIDREIDRYDIYIEGKHGISFDYLTVHDQRYINIRVFEKRGTIISFQVNLADCDKVVLI